MKSCIMLTVTTSIIALQGYAQLPINWKLQYHETFDEAIIEPAVWTEDTYGNNSPWHVPPFDEDGDYFIGLNGSTFTNDLASFRSFRKQFTYGQDNWLTIELYGRDADKDGDPETGGSFINDNGMAKLISTRHWDGGIIRSTQALPPKYRVEVTVSNILFGGDTNNNGDWTDDYSGKSFNGYNEDELATPWKFKTNPYKPTYSYSENGVYFLCITDYEKPAPHNNVFIHHHRKVVMDTDNNWDGESSPWSSIWNPLKNKFETDGNRYINMLWLDGTTWGSDWTGNAFRSWTPNGWQTGAKFADKYIPTEKYTFSVERDGENYTLSITGNFVYGGNTTYKASKPFTSNPVTWHYNQTPEEYNGAYNEVKTYNGNTYNTWPAGSAYPDYFFFGDPHINFYEGTAHFDDVKLYLPDTSKTEVLSIETGTTILQQNYPNPFNFSTSIEYSIKYPCHVVLEVYNAQGAKVANLATMNMEANNYVTNWNATNDEGSAVPNGVYFYRLTTQDNKGVICNLTKSMVVKR